MSSEVKFTENWDNYLDYFSKECRDIYFREEYVKLYASEKDRAECFIYKKGDNVLLFPYLKRMVELLDGEYSDFETAYGYGGPIVNTEDAFFIGEALDEFKSRAKENKIIAGFIRFHPLLDNYLLLVDKSEVIFDRKTVAMNLDMEQEEIWGEIHSKHRNSIRKAQEFGLIFSPDERLKNLSVFRGLYKLTMDRLKAKDYYYFDDKYFNNLNNLNEYIFLGLISQNDKIVSAGLFFKNGIFGHYHLSGSLTEYNYYNSNSFLIYGAALFLKERGIKIFHLGGGSDNSKDNSLYKFKSRFSRNTRSFFIGKLLLDKEKYTEASDIWDREFPERKEMASKIFLKYRF